MKSVDRSLLRPASTSSRNSAQFKSLATALITMATLLCFMALVTTTLAVQECRMSKHGQDYLGTTSVTYKGVTCQRWDSQSPYRYRVFLHERHAPLQASYMCHTNTRKHFRKHHTGRVLCCVERGRVRPRPHRGLTTEDTANGSHLSSQPCWAFSGSEVGALRSCNAAPSMVLSNPTSSPYLGFLVCTMYMCLECFFGDSVDPA